MVRSLFRAKSAVTACLLSIPALCVFDACSSQSSSAPPPNPNTNFGDSGPEKKHDATTPTKPKDSGVEGKKDGVAKDGVARDGVATDSVAKDASYGTPDGAGDAAPETPCKTDDQCNSHVCAPPSLDAGGHDGGPPDAGVCAAAKCVCQTPTCNDHVKNGNETGVDCGGSCPPCGVSVTCTTGSDCSTGECGVGFKGGPCTGTAVDGGADAAHSLAGCVCEAPTCSDGVKNGGESDVDCGGDECPHCGIGKTCSQNTDCTSDICSAGTAGNRCACPSDMTEASTTVQAAYCIDTYEVTYADYLVFTNENIPTSTQPPECAWNGTFIPSNHWPQTTFQYNPVTNVNWCDAYAYCQAANKHLCGAIANTATGVVEGAPVPFGSLPDGGGTPANDPTVDEWFNACSAQGQNVYPYGSSYGPLRCNGADSPAQGMSGPVEVPPGATGYSLDSAMPCILDQTCNSPPGNLHTVSKDETVSCELLGPDSPPGTLPSCGTAFGEGGCWGGISPDLRDMSGNVAEWVNSCSGVTAGDGGVNDTCLVRGGSFDSAPGNTSLTCATNSAQPAAPRNTSADDIGFRCCL
jgi:formylglycine-generating enzyme required for sulfatase activity